MGVQGLTSLLEKSSCRPKVVDLPLTRPGQVPQAALRDGNILLVDGTAMQYCLCENLGSRIADWTDPSCHEAIYTAAQRFYAPLQACGLHCVLVMDGACAPGHEQTYVERRRKFMKEIKAGSAAVLSPLVEVVMMHAYLDMGLDVRRSVHCADKLLLALYHEQPAKVFAVLTNDSDFYVYGVHRIVHYEGVHHLPVGGCVQLAVWNSSEAWLRLRKESAEKVRGVVVGAPLTNAVTLEQRAQVAAVLGNDEDKGVRMRLSARAAGQAASRAPGYIMGPAAAARRVLLCSGAPLGLPFFRNELGLKKFGELELGAFAAVERSYQDDVAAARSGAMRSELLLGEQSLPWLAPALARRLASLPVPGMLVSCAGRGLFCLALPEPHWSSLQYIRRAVAVQLHAPGAIHEYDMTNNRLHLLAPPPPPPPATAAPSDWLKPAEDLPELSIISRRSPAAAVDLAPLTSLAQRFRALQEAHPELPPTLLMHGALLLHAVAAPPGDDDSFRAASKQLLLPGLGEASSTLALEARATLVPEAVRETAATDPCSGRSASADSRAEVSSALPQGLRYQHQLRRQVVEALVLSVGGSGDRTEAVAAELQALQEAAPGGPGVSGGLSRAGVACCVLSAVLRSLLPLGPDTPHEFSALSDDVAAAPDDVLASKAALLAAATGRLARWGALEPVKLLAQLEAEEQAQLLAALESLCMESQQGTDDASEGAALEAEGCTAAARIGPGGAFLPIAMQLLEWLYEMQVLVDEGLVAWAAVAAADSAFMEAVQAWPVLEWLL